MYQYEYTSDQKNIPMNGGSCAIQVGLDIDQFNLCSNTPKLANKALLESVERTHKAKVKVSCTIMINDNTWCVHDSEWKECGGEKDKPGDLSQAVCDAYEGDKKPEVCDQKHRKRHHHHS
jgi:hypothetical protein